MSTYFLGIVAVAIVVAILFRVMHGGMDHNRIGAYIEARGGKVIDASWVPFGPGWEGKGKDRIYEVRYVDKDGNPHHAYCKTSGWSGVYFTEDKIERTGEVGDEKRSLEEENRRLREELERLKRRQS